MDVKTCKRRMQCLQEDVEESELRVSVGVEKLSEDDIGWLVRMYE